MSKKITHPWFQKTYRFPQDFQDIYEEFSKIILLMPEIKDNATKDQISRGFESAGIRYAIRELVETNRYLLIEKLREKAEKEANKNNA